MDKKKIIGLLLVIIIGVVAISGCTGGDNNNTNAVKDKDNLTDEEKEEISKSVNSQYAITIAALKFSEDNPDYSYDMQKSSADLTTYNGKEMYLVTLCVIDKNNKESYVKYYVDTNDETVILA